MATTNPREHQALTVLASGYGAPRDTYHVNHIQSSFSVSCPERKPWVIRTISKS